jgi:hypothetical protein
MSKGEIIIREDGDSRIEHLLCRVIRMLDDIERKGDTFMGTTNDALAELKKQMAQLQTDVAAQQATDTQILADVAKLVAGGTVLPNGQVAVSAADIQDLVASAQKLDASVVAEMAGDVAADATVNPPAPGPQTVPGVAGTVDPTTAAALNRSKTGLTT